MHKILITITASITLSMGLPGCSTVENLTLGLPDAASKLPLMYRPTVQQGNVIDQETVNKLKPGISKRQVTYLLGTPSLIDSFHQNRWDYVYTLKENTEPLEMKNITLFFEDDRLIRTEGDYRPMVVDEMEVADRKETVVDVPDYEPEKKGFITRTLNAIGIQEIE